MVQHDPGRKLPGRGRHPGRRRRPPVVRPPGSVPESEFLQLCIRCGECAAVCPVQLLPQQLLWHAGDDDEADDLMVRIFETAEGLEMTFAVHVAGPHLLTRLLRGRLAAADDARVVWVSSGALLIMLSSVPFPPVVCTVRRSRDHSG